jgi:uncharacterized protein GlcG (DUF336 family)
MKNKLKLITAIALAGALASGMAQANNKKKVKCPVSHAQLEQAISAAQGEPNGGFALDMWATVINREGIVCAVARSGDGPGDQWPGSRVISAQKANTANAFSLPGLALSTANLWAATQPGGSLFGLQHSNPVDTKNAYRGNFWRYGKKNDPLVSKRIGGVNVFGGGLALYNEYGTLVGAVGVSGDSSCADHNIAWRVRDTLGLDFVPGGVGTPGDNIIFDLADDFGGNPESPSGFGHPTCGVSDEQMANNDVIFACPLSDGATAGCVAN